MNKSDSIDQLATALAKAQSQMEAAKKDSTNPFFKSKYADLTSCWEACRTPLTQNGLSVVQTSSVTEHGGLILNTMLLHVSGQWISGAMPVKPVKEDLQAVGAALSYMRRYSLMAIIGLCADDDDAESAMQRPPQTIRPTQTIKTQNR